MGVPVFIVVTTGLTATIGGGVLLLMVALWWAWVGDGISVPRERWPGAVRAAAVVGWALFFGGMLTQVVGHFAQVGVARW